MRAAGLVLILSLCGCVTDSGETGRAPASQEIYLEKSDARAFVDTEWTGVWRNAKYSSAGDMKAVARFHALPAEGLYDLGQVQGEFIYYNPPGMLGSNGLGFTRYPLKEGYALGFIANGKLRISGDKVSKSVWVTKPGCLALKISTITNDGHAFFARFDRCDPAGFARIFERINK